MAKLCSPFGTSPVNSFFNELTPNAFADDFHQIQPDPFDFFEDLPSICSDIQKIESDTFAQYCGGMDLDLDMKPEVRNTDLMWWTAPPTSMLSTSASSMSSDISSGVSLAAVMGAAANTTPQIANTTIKQEKDEQQQHTPTIVTAKKINPMNFNGNAIINIKQEPTEDVEQQLAYNSIPNNKTAGQTTAQPQLILQNVGTTPTSMSSTMQNIPPGTSLLRKSQQQQQQQQQQKKSPPQLRGSSSSLHIIKRGDQLLPSANAINVNFTSNASSLFHTTNSSSSSSNNNNNNCPTDSSPLLYQRPDTPHSLDDDSSTTEFRHNVDLRACVMGSNNISLTTDQDFIKNVTEELQDTSKKQFDTRYAVGGCSLTDVLEVISSSPNSSHDFLNLKNTTSALTPSTTCSSAFSFHSADTSVSMRSSESESDEESTMGSSSSSLLDHDITYNTGGVSPVSSQASNMGSSSQHYMQHRDHSYTRYKDDLSTNLETPSDSEEEIDVVSINDKKLPTNPSDKDRRVLQTKVAHKFNASRIVKTPSSIRTIPPRRGSYEFPYTPASSSPVKSVNNSRFPSPAVTPYQSQYTTKYVQQQQVMAVVVGGDGSSGAATVPLNIFSSNDKTRKRLLVNGNSNGSNNNNNSNNTNNAHNVHNELNANNATNNGGINSPHNNNSKKHRGKKTKLVAAVQLHNGLKRHYSVDDTADTIEKRNLHNDMERQRRIGLKNLFEALKKQIPSIKDKERAPKVNILREAAKLCEALTREDQQLMEQKAKLKEELRRKQELLSKMKAAQQLE